MTPAARAAAAIDILDRILDGQAAEAALIRWARASRFAGSGDRAAVRDLVFDALRRLRSRAALGGALSGRGLLLGMCREEGIDPATLFTGEGHAPPALSEGEGQAGRAPTSDEALDLPDWLLPLWRKALGGDAEPVALAMRDRAPVWLRVNLRRADPARAAAAMAEQGIATAPHPDLPTALRITEGARRLAGCHAYREGLVELQDLSPQMACALLPAQGSLLDFCAGGGGKALALAAQGAGPVTAHDIDAGRMADLPARAERAGVRIRLAAPGKVAGRFDTVVADVPCSGSGTWRRGPDAKWRLTRDDLEQLAARQCRILDQAAGFVADGGHLAYMTCSVLDAENDDQVQGFLARNRRFEQVLARRFTPLTASDGFYLALMRRR
ncbi:RsmB/NOP family class I SAM-dependent RNA methyltransferase [Paracoccus denitrificans]|uniref:RsmB/NOP family class I SAM-dependent RNA methyltransferase n=1 Tax=Paracoccus denitrificans TaxID=266 RepID=UPI001E31627C|nr:RsmB/NOP family class I SAM-dependent RNA methyltransferase [Paracoccus denitrificans]UFS64096.1 RsmB/NOP family class I SAM-dependent RNA methyltransferase [Paracoccus denitrificans]